MEKIIKKLFNSPIILKKFPMIDSVEVYGIRERQFSNNYFIDANIYLKEEPMDAWEKDTLLGTFLELLKHIEFGGPFNYVRMNFYIINE